MAKYIACERTVPELKPLLEEIREHRERSESEMEFVKKQVKNRFEELQKSKRVIWEKIEVVLLEKGLIEKKHADPESDWMLYLSKDEQLMLQLREEDGHPIEKLLKHLMT